MLCFSATKQDGLNDKLQYRYLPDGTVETLQVSRELGGVVEGGWVAPQELIVPGLGGEVADGPLLGVQNL